MANEKKNGTLEEIIMEMLKEGKAVRIPIKDVVDKQQEKDFADRHSLAVIVLLEERRAGKPLCHDGERRSNALTLTGTADETVKPERAA